jgi:hypothetical protein
LNKAQISSFFISVLCQAGLRPIISTRRGETILQVDCIFAFEMAAKKALLSRVFPQVCPLLSRQFSLGAGVVARLAEQMCWPAEQV